MATPPSANPLPYPARNRVHWANPEEIKPGLWLVEEGSGPKATTRGYCLVREKPNGKWFYIGRVTPPRYASVTLDVGWLDQRSWMLRAPETATGELIELLREIGRKHA